MLLAALLIGVTLALPALAPTQEAVAQATPASDAAVPASDPAALTLLRRAASVADSRSWQGDEVVAANMVGPNTDAGPLTEVLAVRHRALVGTDVTVIDGATPEQTTFDPDAPVMVSATLPSSLGLEAVAEGTQWATLLANGYVTTIAGQDKVAGEPCTVLTSTRADGTLAAKIWVGKRSGLVLQRQIFDAGGHLLRYSAFTEVALVADSSVGPLTTDLRAAAAGQIAVGTPLQPSTLASSNVVAPDTLAGTLTLVDAREFGTGRSATFQLTYSDGLSSMTVSEQRGRLPAKPPAGWQRISRDGTVVQQRAGLPERVAWSDRGTVYTVVSDTDAATLDAVLLALPRPAAGASYGRRMRAGLDRIGSWLDPTH